MAETETGWKKTFPTEHGDYWLRFTDPVSDACMVEVNRRGVFEAGVTGDIRNRVVIDECEWLGPISPSDFEQLTRLREAAEKFVTTYEGKEHQLGNGQALRSFLQFREALAQRSTGGEKS